MCALHKANNPVHITKHCIMSIIVVCILESWLCKLIKFAACESVLYSSIQHTLRFAQVESFIYTSLRNIPPTQVLEDYSQHWLHLTALHSTLPCILGTDACPNLLLWMVVLCLAQIHYLCMVVTHCNLRTAGDAYS